MPEAATDQDNEEKKLRQRPLSQCLHVAGLALPPRMQRSQQMNPAPSASSSPGLESRALMQECKDSVSRSTEIGARRWKIGRAESKRPKSKEGREKGAKEKADDEGSQERWCPEAKQWGGQARKSLGKGNLTP